MKKINIAIDGPVASGKTTVARRVAKELNYSYIDTGAMYRAVTWKVIQDGIDISQEEEIVKLAGKMKIDIKPTEKNTSGYLIFADGIDITDFITEPPVRRLVSPVSAISGVRRVLVEQQKRMAEKKGIIMAGRDITSVVLPEAEVKIYLTATPEERAKRRYREVLAKGEVTTCEEILEEVKRRDKIDSEREDSPLVKVPDAIELDTTGMEFEEVIRKIISMVII